MPREDKVICRTPTPGKKPTRIDRWKFDTLREVILDVLPAKGEGVPFTELKGKVEDGLPPAELKKIGSLMWYVTTVKLELEVRGEIERVKDAVPQRLVRKRSKARR